MVTKNIQLELTIEETNLILEALGSQPFARVYVLIGRIQEGARRQLEEPPVASGPASIAASTTPTIGNGAAHHAAREPAQ